MNIIKKINTIYNEIINIKSILDIKSKESYYTQRVNIFNEELEELQKINVDEYLFKLPTTEDILK